MHRVLLNPSLELVVRSAHEKKIHRTNIPRFFRPRSPVHRVVGVLQEVGTGLVDEGVGVGMRSCAGHGGMRGAGYFVVVLARSEDTQ